MGKANLSLFPRFVTRRPAILFRSSRGVVLYLILNIFLLIDLNLQCVRISTPNGSIPCSRRAAIFSRRTICWSFNSSICSVVIWNLQLFSYSIIFRPEIHYVLPIKTKIRWKKKMQLLEWILKNIRPCWLSKLFTTCIGTGFRQSYSKQHQKGAWRILSNSSWLAPIFYS